MVDNNEKQGLNQKDSFGTLLNKTVHAQRYKKKVDCFCPYSLQRSVKNQRKCDIKINLKDYGVTKKFRYRNREVTLSYKLRDKNDCEIPPVGAL